MWRNPRTARIGPRKHLKTTVGLGYLAWKILRMEHKYNEWDFMSYKEELGAYHIKRLKRYMAEMPEFRGHESLTRAEGIIHVAHQGKEFVVSPSGILSFKRGKHPHGIICDDILRDPEVKLDISQLKKIEQSFFEEVESMPTEELHVCGTPQDRNDLFGALESKGEYKTIRTPAILNHDSQEVLWPEEFPYAKLMQIRKNIGEKAFNKEYQCRPSRGEEGFLQESKLDRMIKSRIKHYSIFDKPKFNEFTFGGLDIGKKSHPSHLCVLGVSRKRVIQVHSKWMDGWDYKDQIEYCRQAIKAFRMSSLLYDNTRAEFEGFSECGTLPSEMEGVTMTAKEKFEEASLLDSIVSQGKLWLLNEERQKRQLLNVDNDLKAVETDEGHGDCFFSLCLALKAQQYGGTPLVIVI